MRNFAALLVIAGMFAAAPDAAASDRDEALAILSKAVKAHGGEEALAKAAQFTRKGSGTITIFDKDLSITEEYAAALPDRFRLVLDVTGADKQKTHFVLVGNGDSGWQDNGGAVEPLSKERLAEFQQETYCQWVSLLVPVIKETDFQLTPLPAIKVNDRAAVGVKVAHKGRPDVNLYSDKDNGLLVKVSRKGPEAGVEVLKDFYFSDYKEVDGAKLPFQLMQTLNQKKYTEIKVTGYKLGKPDDKLFEKP